MGAVFLARDTRLDRPVALKVLRDDRRSATERARLDREARILAQLAHPRICTLLDIVQTDEDTLLVMEALDGETLANRLARHGSGLSADECLSIAADVSEGLAYAHRRGVVHGDVKPSNIMLTPAGAKLLDFGIATLRASAASSEATATADVLLHAGTLPYMAPEQLDGRTDTRSDLFALGAVLYEMLTGTRAFVGTTTSEVVARILDSNRPSMPPGVEPSLARVVRRCLATDPDRRWQSAEDLADELRWIAHQPSRLAVPDERPRRDASAPARAGSRVRGAGLLGVLAAGVVGYWLVRAPPASEPDALPPLRVDLALPSGTSMVVGSSPALSRDGRFLAFVAAQAGARLLHVRDLQTAEVAPLQGTNGAVDPFWSPDGSWLAFFADGTLKRVARNGGAVQTIAQVSPNHTHPSGADWSRDDVILFNDAYLPSGAIWRVPASGGTPTLVASPERDRNEQSFTWPRFLPDGRRFLYVRDSGRQEGPDGALAGSRRRRSGARRDVVGHPPAIWRAAVRAQQVDHVAALRHRPPRAHRRTDAPRRTRRSVRHARRRVRCNGGSCGVPARGDTSARCRVVCTQRSAARRDRAS